MITNLNIKNFALIKNLQIKFSSGLNVFIGETGSGKSIILNALGFVLGNKATKTQIRTGEEQILVEAVFNNIKDETKSILIEFGFLQNLSDFNDEILILNRTFNISGKSECRINGRIISLSMLKQITETLVDSYGQHESQALLKSTNHISILDSYKPELLQNLKVQIDKFLQEYKKVQSDLKELGGSFNNRERMLNLLQFQIKEIESIDPKTDEDKEIESKLLEIKNFEKILNSLNSTYDFLDGNFSAMQSLKNAIKSLTYITQYNNLFENLNERLNSSLLEIQDIASNIKNESNNINYSEKELLLLDDRLDKIKQLKKKYGKTIEEILLFLNNAYKEEEKLKNAEEQVYSLNLKLKELTSILKLKSLELSNIRRKLALEIEQKVLKELSFIGMQKAKFQIKFNNIVGLDCEKNSQNLEKPNSKIESKDKFNYFFNKAIDDKNENQCELKFTSNGIDNVEFLFSANLGEPLKPLNQIISGGEMSRFMLALKNISASTDDVSTLIFDEIDSGISGEIGSAIAEKIANLSRKFQVLCITHLPQVSAMADSYFHVYKEVSHNSTKTKVSVLSDNKIFSHLAKLSGSKEETEVSLAHAKELKNRANKYKATIK